MSAPQRVELRWSSDGARLTVLAWDGEAGVVQGHGVARPGVSWKRPLARDGSLTRDGSGLVVMSERSGFSVRCPRTSEELCGFAAGKAQLFGPAVPSPDGLLFACEAFVDSAFRTGLWSLSSGREVLHMPRATGWWAGTAERTRFSTDGSLLLACHDEDSGVVRRWELREARELPPLLGHLDTVLDVACSDERWLASVDRSDHLLIWRPDGTRRRLVSGLQGQCLALSACGGLLAVGGARGQVGLFDPASGELLELHELSTAPVRELAFSPDGRQLASASAALEVSVLDVGGRVRGQRRPSPPLQREGEPADEALAALRAQLLEQELASGVGEAHRQASLRLLERHGGRLQHTGSLLSEYTSAAVSPDGRYLALGTEVPYQLWEQAEGVIQIWEIASGRCVHRIECAGDGVRHERGRIETDLMRWSPDSTRLAVSYYMNQIGIWDALEGRGWPAICLLPEPIDLTVNFDWSPDGRSLAFNVGTGPRSVGSFLLSEGDFQGPEAARWLPTPDIPEDYAYRSLRWSADGERLVGYGYRTVEVRCAMTGRLLLQRPEEGTSVSPDGRYVLLEEPGELVCTGTGEILPAPWVCGARASGWSADGARIALLWSDHVEVRAVPGGERLCVLPVTPVVPNSDGYFGFKEAVAFAFSRDGALGAFFSAAGVELWSLGPAPEPLGLLPELQQSVGLAFGGDGQTLVTWGRRAVAFWSVPSRRLLNRFDLNLPMGLDFCGEQGHPLVHPHGHFGRRFEPDAAFPYPVRGRWCWMGAFPSGLLVCPPEALPAFRACASLVIGRGFGWPLHWLLGTEAVELHPSWPSAVGSERLPPELPDEVRRWLLSPPEPDPSWGFAPATLQNEGAEVQQVLLPTALDGGYELEHALYGEALTAESLRAYLGKVMISASSWIRLGALVACSAEQVQLATATGRSHQPLPLPWIGPARFLADARVLPPVERPAETLEGRRFWVADPEMARVLSARGAQLQEAISESTELVVLGEPVPPGLLQRVDQWHLPCVPRRSFAWMLEEEAE
jgi:WD40 repeat protein